MATNLFSWVAYQQTAVAMPNPENEVESDMLSDRSRSSAYNWDFSLKKSNLLDGRNLKRKSVPR